MARHITLNGQTLECIDSIPPAVYVDLVENFRGNATVAAVKFLQAMVRPADRERLNAILSDTENVLPWTELNEAATKLIEDISTRPTERPSDSQAGSAPTGETSRADSPSPVMEKVAETRSLAGRSAAS